MKLNINFNHLESTPAITAKIESKSSKLKKFFDGGFDVNWTCSVDKSGHTSKIHINYKGLSVNADSTKDDLYKTFDDVIHKVERQLEKHKAQMKDNVHGHESHTNLEFVDENAAEDEEEY
jgi:putative sigma-54 modulation protein